MTTNSSAPLPLVPWPASVKTAPDVPLPGAIRRTPRTSAVADLIAEDLGRITGEPPEDARDDEPAISLVLDPSVAGREAYLLNTGVGVQITASTTEGLYRGSRTLLQLLEWNGEIWLVRGAQIQDAPRYEYRGAMLDVSRHFFGVPTVLGVIDRIADLKLNALHLHLSDDQGFRIALASRPELAELGSTTQVGGGRGGHYTEEDYSAIVKYAADRFITIVPEIDMPSHSHAISIAYPDLVDSPIMSENVENQARDLGLPMPVRGEPYTSWIVGFSSIKDIDATWPLVHDIFADLARLTPGPYLHIGGDEAHGTSPEEFASFVAKATEQVVEVGKTPIAWQEVVKSDGLADGTVLQYWGYTTADAEVAVAAASHTAKGGRIIASPADAAYLDMKYDQDFPIGFDWADGPTTVEHSYGWDPETIFTDAAVQQAVLGVEAPLWTETVETAQHIDTLMFPRVASAAEIGWSPRTDDERTWERFRARVAQLGPAWTEAGIAFHDSEEIDWVTD